MKCPDKREAKGITAALEEILSRHNGDYIVISDLVGALQERGFALLMMLIVLPNCVPVPVPPGVSTIFSLPLLFFASQMVIGRASPWLPGKLMGAKVKRDFLLRSLEIAGPRLRELELNTRPRLEFLVSPYGERLVGTVWLVLALSIAVPLPFTNFLPGIGILISAFSLLRRDGLGMIIGFCIGALGVAVTLSLLVFGAAAIKKALIM